MGYQCDGQYIATDEHGYLLNHTQWSETLAEVIAQAENIRTKC